MITSPKRGGRRALGRVAQRIASATGEMALFTTVAAVAGFGIELVLARALAPAAYADMSTLLALSAQLAVGQTVLQLATARQSALGLPSRTWRTLALVAGAGLVVIGSVVGAPLARFWHLPLLTVPALFTIGAGWFYLGTLRGAVQGLEQYRLFGGSLAAENIVRLAVTAVLVPVAGVWGGLAGMAAGVAAALVYLIGEAAMPRGPSIAIPWPVLAWTGVGVAATAATPHLDLLVVKHAWDTDRAAAWSALTLFGKGLTQLPWLVSTVIFPRVVRDRERRVLYFRLSAAMAALVLVAAATAGLFAAPAAAHAFFAGRYDRWSSVFRVYLWAAIPVTLYGLWIGYAIAEQGRRKLSVLALGVAAYAIALALHHATMGDVMGDYAVLGAFEVSVLTWDTLVARRQAKARA